MYSHNTVTATITVKIWITTVNYFSLKIAQYRSNFALVRSLSKGRIF